MKQKITIIGAGLAGCFLAILFAKRGYKVTVFEQSSEKVMGVNASKRSFALVMYGYGVDVLKKVGLWDVLSPFFLPLEGSVTQIGNRKQIKPIIARMSDAPFYAISRAAFLKGLLKEAKKYQSITFHFGKCLVAVDERTKTIQVKDKKTKKLETVACDVVFGADGVNSIVRNFLQKKNKDVHIKEHIKWTYKQIFFTKELAKKCGFQGIFSQNWTRKNAIFVAYPNHNGSYHGMFILPQESSYSFSSLQTKTVLRKFIRTYFPDFIPAFPEIFNVFLHNPEGHFVTIKTSSWHDKNFTAILGDAAHGFPPFYGQGVSAAIADSMELIRLVEKYGSQWEKIFRSYQNIRKKNTDVLAVLSNQTLQSYRREKKADYTAIYAKLESLLHSLFPALFSPPPFSLVAVDQTHAAEYVRKHIMQRKRARYIGIPVIVAILTGIVAAQEMLASLYKRVS